ncbi:hypothetical protein V1514DRAFT_343546 [Lipomyces japonicus]|uniref:mitochondrial 54S ribosomal protein mL59 n=1 Tax=Lipomyces japonicus TaxID=56871 RepID=UPI0034CE48FA
MASTKSTVAEVFAKLPPVLSKFFQQYPPTPLVKYARKPISFKAGNMNPFLMSINKATKKYREPIFSLRKQSEIYKAALEFGLESLLPTMNKKFGLEKFRTKKPMKGVVRFKGSKDERTAEARRVKREEAIAKADEIITKIRGPKYQRKVEKRKLGPKNLF